MDSQADLSLRWAHRSFCLFCHAVAHRIMHESRLRCPSILSSIAIELNVPHEEFSSIAIKLTFVILGHGFKKAGSVLYDICAPF